ncbi:YbaB/EbfC family nucleoid-associated protein [Nocardia sp. NPDC051570]|uniref:YbaB/EbfC family nucleoid-associated protein n=1 Tax=Nocardia sp. NPDC051570 TaxID=3364324 RepID=UPI0037AEB2E0
MTAVLPVLECVATTGLDAHHGANDGESRSAHGKLTQIRRCGEAVGGRVCVEVDVEGEITRLTLSPDLSGTDLPDLAAAITQAHKTARARARAAATDISRELREPYIGGFIHQMTTAGELFGFSDPALPNPAQPIGDEDGPSPVDESGW